MGGAGEAGGEGAGGHGRDPVGGQVLPLRLHSISRAKYNFLHPADRPLLRHLSH